MGKRKVDGRALVLSREEVMDFERISPSAFYRRLEAGEYVKAKTGMRKPNGEKIYGIPAWCLSPRGRKHFLHKHPEFRSFLKVTAPQEPK